MSVEEDTKIEEIDIDKDAQKLKDAEANDISNLTEEEVAAMLLMPDEKMLNVRIQERIEVEKTYRTLAMRLNMAKLSLTANENMKNDQGVTAAKVLISGLNLEMAHALRSIVYIDEKYPDAKKLIKQRLERDAQVSNTSK